MTYRQGCGHTELIQRRSLWLNTQREDFYPRAEFCFLLFLTFCRAAEVAGRARRGGLNRQFRLRRITSYCCSAAWGRW